MPLDLVQSQLLLVRIVEEGFAQRHSPLPGAYVKVQLLSRAVDQGETFSEQTLGFKGFLDFVKTVQQVAIQWRSGSDVLLAPITASDVLSAFAEPLPRLRRDFWRACPSAGRRARATCFRRIWHCRNSNPQGKKVRRPAAR